MKYSQSALVIFPTVIEKIVALLVELEQEQKRLEYYMSLLAERQVTVLQLIYFKRLPLEKIAAQIGVVLRTVRKIKDRAIDKLTEMYNFTDKLNEFKGPFWASLRTQKFLNFSYPMYLNVSQILCYH